MTEVCLLREGSGLAGFVLGWVLGSLVDEGQCDGLAALDKHGLARGHACVLELGRGLGCLGHVQLLLPGHVLMHKRLHLFGRLALGGSHLALGARNHACAHVQLLTLHCC